MDKQLLVLLKSQFNGKTVEAIKAYARHRKAVIKESLVLAKDWETTLKLQAEYHSLNNWENIEDILKQETKRD